MDERTRILKESKTVLRLIKMQHSGIELEYQLQAWAVHPTLTTDCLIKSMEKAALRAKFVKELKQQKLS